MYGSMSTTETLNRLATRLGVRPLARRAYRSMRILEYKLAGETYTVEIGGANAEFLIPTQNEFSDLRQIEERPILEDLLDEIRPDDVFYDIGANIGLYSCLVADIVTEPVIAFEPHPANADRMEQNVELNDADVSLFRCALADADGEAELSITLDKVGSAGHSLVSDPNTSIGSVTITKRHGDDLIAEEGVPQPTVLKIDVEGAEFEVLKGLESTLSRTECRVVYCETHADRLESEGHSVAAVREILEEHGFSITDRVIRDGKGETFLIGKK